jgi:hypothetical protein
MIMTSLIHEISLELKRRWRRLCKRAEHVKQKKINTFHIYVDSLSGDIKICYILLIHKNHMFNIKVPALFPYPLTLELLFYFESTEKSYLLFLFNRRQRQGRSCYLRLIMKLFCDCHLIFLLFVRICSFIIRKLRVQHLVSIRLVHTIYLIALLTFVLKV